MDIVSRVLRVAEKESVNKMSLHNLATVFGPTLLRPSEKDSKIPANPTQPISMGDSWSLEVMAQVKSPSSAQSHFSCFVYNPDRVLSGPGVAVLPSAGDHPHTRQQTTEHPLLHGGVDQDQGQTRACPVLKNCARTV